MKIPFIPDDAPFSGDQRSYISGFLAGLHSRTASSQNAVTPDAQQPTELNILYGTQTGNAESVAEDTAKMAQSQGFKAVVAAMDDVAMDAFAAMERVVVVVSTYGEGEMPDNGELFWGSLAASDAPKLYGMHFGVIALGDTGYDEFCQAGKLIDTRLEQLGATRLLARVDCDIDYEEPSDQWARMFLPLANKGPAVVIEPTPAPEIKKSGWNRKNPYASKVMVNRSLSGLQSAKDIRHYELSLGESGLSYEAGDALGVMPVNGPTLVHDMINWLGVNADTAVTGYDQPLSQLLENKFEISTPSRDLIREIERKAGHEELSHIVANGDKEALDAFLWGRDSLDLLNLNPKLTMEPDLLVSLLKPLQHRAYSISSSPKAHIGEVHMTIASVRWTHAGRPHNGVCSTYLADGCAVGAEAGIFVSPNKAFRVPSDESAPMIMVGPGTGVAPFRAFLEERQARGSTGINWLFFGDQHRASDYIYSEQLGRMSNDGFLTRLDLAFSRDQAEKIYVQHRMIEQGKDLFALLEDGAYFYVCGDATRMAKDVDAALRSVIQTQGGMTPEAATDYVNRLKRDKRYLRDVY